MSGLRTGPDELVDNQGQRRRRPVSSAGSLAVGPQYFEMQNAPESHTCRCIDVHLLAERLRLASRQGLPFGQSSMPIGIETSTWGHINPHSVRWSWRQSWPRDVLRQQAGRLRLLRRPLGTRDSDGKIRSHWTDRWDRACKNAQASHPDQTSCHRRQGEDEWHERREKVARAR